MSSSTSSSLLSPTQPSGGASPYAAPTSFLPSFMIIAALLAFVFLASVAIHLLLRFLSDRTSSSSSSNPQPPLPPTHRDEVHSSGTAGSDSAARPAAAADEGKKQEAPSDEKQRLIDSLPLFTMASALAALPKSSPDCAVCLSPFTPDAELRLLPACRHAFHAACVDAWLRTTPSCPLCRAAVSLPHPPLPTAAPGTQQQEPLDARSSNNNSRSFRVEIGSVSNRRSSAAGDDRRTYSLGSFDYRVDEEVEAVVARIARPAAAAKSSTPAAAAQATPAEALADAAGSRGWLREYVDRLASSASSLSGRWSARWSQGHHSHSHRHDDSWRWDPEVGSATSRAPDEEEPGFIALYRWIVGV